LWHNLSKFVIQTGLYCSKQLETRDVNKTFFTRPRPRLFVSRPRPRPRLSGQDQEQDIVPQDQDQDLHMVSDNLAKDSYKQCT